jgi:RNA polymerase sigma-70 factor (ECF subfamily)
MATPSRTREISLVEADTAAAASRPAPEPPSAWDYRLAVVRHYRAVFAYAATILGNRADAEDVTQETFLRFGQRGGGIRRPREWLLSVARNLCYDRFRASAKTTVLDGEMFESMAGGSEPDSAAEQAETRTRLLSLVAALPEPQRSLVVLFDVQGMTGDECARILGLTTNQVKVYLHRARRRLRQRMEAKQ